MHFDLVDRVLEASTEGAATLKQVTIAEEYLQDHFPTYPVLPGVLMLEAMVQAARVVARERGIAEPLVCGEVRALKYNRFVPPGAAIRAEVRVDRSEAPGTLGFRGQVVLVESGSEEVVAASGRFVLRQIRTRGGLSVGNGTEGA
jgi:3-hydroxyacyl-[acyl-carrier-protein] dehydratase